MTFLTIREAAEKTGHSTHKIRRLVKAIADKPKNADRSYVEPSPADAERLNTEGVQFTWRITEEIVRRELGDAAAAAPGEKPERGVGESAGALSVIERAMAAHEKAASQICEQLRVKDEQIAALNERLRESNLLMGSLQKQLAAPGGNRGVESSQETVTVEPTRGGNRPVGKSKRRGWLKKIFS